MTRAPDELTARLRAAGCVFAEDEARLIRQAAATPTAREELVRRRVGGEPLEYVLGWVRFCGATIGLDAGVFIPRQRTEFLARRAAALVGPGDVVLDLCCGSGAIAVVLAHLSRPGELHAADVDPAAVRCARRNLEPLGGAVYEGDLFAPLPERLRGRIDVLVANLPYVPTTALAGMPVEARDHEPAYTHDGGPDGLAVLRRVLADAPTWLSPGGRLLVEIAQEQAESARAAFAAAGLGVRIVSSRVSHATVAVGSRAR